MRSLDDTGNSFGPPQSRFTGHRDARCTFDRFNNSNQLGRPERPAELQEPRREIDHAECACRRPECGFENIRVWQISLCACFFTRGGNSESSAIFAVKKARTHWFGIKSWEATPDDFPFVVNECGELAVPNYPNVFEMHLGTLA